MLLRNSKVIYQPTDSGNFSISIPFITHPNDEDTHCRISKDRYNASSDTLSGERIAGGFLSAVCPLPTTNHGRHKWSHD